MPVKLCKTPPIDFECPMKYEEKLRENKMNNKGLLIVIVILLVGILGVMTVQYTNRPQSVGEQVGEAIEEVGDEIDDATSAQ